MTIVLREMKSDDLDSVLNIEMHAHNHPWTRVDFESSLQSNHHCMVLEKYNTIAGYSISSTAADEAELLNITVKPEFQRQGLGRFLIEQLCAGFNSSIHSLFLEVRKSNHIAFKLYQSCGFNEVGVRPGYYPDSNNKREDAIIMALSLRM